jgi:hypothetical protein
MPFECVVAEIDLSPEPPAFAPRLLSAREAAYYCGVGIPSWNQWVRSGRMPPAILGTRRWDRAAIDAKLDRLSGLGAAPTPQSAREEWKASRARESARN